MAFTARNISTITELARLFAPRWEADLAHRSRRVLPTPFSRA